MFLTEEGVMAYCAGLEIFILEPKYPPVQYLKHQFPPQSKLFDDRFQICTISLTNNRSCPFSTSKVHFLISAAMASL